MRSEICLSIARFLTVRDMFALTHTCARMRNVPPFLWRKLMLMRYPERRKCPCASSACRRLHCPLCVDCAHTLSDWQFALLVENRELQSPCAHARCFTLSDVVGGVEMMSAVCEPSTWDGEIPQYMMRIPLLRGDIVMVPFSHATYIWDGHHAVRARDHTIPSTFLTPTEFAPSYFTIYNRELRFAFDVISVAGKLVTTLEHGCLFECGTMVTVGNRTFVIMPHTTHTNLIKRISRAGICRARLASSSSFIHIAVDLDDAL